MASNLRRGFLCVFERQIVCDDGRAFFGKELRYSGPNTFCRTSNEGCFPNRFIGLTPLYEIDAASYR
jgi:hypothetical protein